MLPILFLRLEGAVLLGLSLFLYGRLDVSWWWFLLVLLPDAGMAGYLGGNTAGAWTYNTFHTYLPPGIVAVAGVASGSHALVAASLIWFAHIGMDRMLGYGLKHITGFKDTHLGRIGRRQD